MEEKSERDMPIDEMCYCGKLRSEHQDLEVPGMSPHPALAGKGECPESGCKRFTWKEYIFKK